MKYTLILAILLTGCATVVPVTQKFPEVPSTLSEKCDTLITLDDNVKLSDVATAVTNNYTLYHKCSNKHDEFIEWYNNQKRIHESVK